MSLAERYASMLRKLLPPGKAWEAEPGSVLASLLSALSLEPARVHERALQLIEEADPRTATELLPDHERMVGIDQDACVQNATIAGRRAAVVAKRTADNDGPSSTPRVTELAETTGYGIQIRKHFKPYTCVSPCNAPFYDEPWVHVWDVFAVPGGDDALFECLIKDLEQLHEVLRIYWGLRWVARTAAQANTWRGVCWSPELELFCAVSDDGTNRVMTSPDGFVWTARTAAEANAWQSVCWSPALGLFCAVAAGGTNRAMTSPDGINWTPRALTGAFFLDVCWSPQRNLFVAVGTNRAIYTSSNGTSWTSRFPGDMGGWQGVCWSPERGLFVAVGTDTVGTSTDGLSWTTAIIPGFPSLDAVCWSPELGLFAAVGASGSVRTSPDGIVWTTRSGASGDAIVWFAEVKRFVVVSNGGVFTSHDGITWQFSAAAEANDWQYVCVAPELGRILSVSSNGSHRVMSGWR